MTTLSGILEGKTGNYYKLEDAGEDAFCILEDIDPVKTELRQEKVKSEKFKNTKGEQDYYHILVGCGTVQKDLSLTFTALKQLAEVMPRKENWKGYTFKYLGSKGSGKNIKYQYQVTGKAAPGTQTQFMPAVNLIADPAGALLAEMKKSDGWDNGAFGELVMKHVNGDMSASFALVDKLKKEGKVVQEGAMWRAT